jgi:hypothetical protein
MLRAIFRLLLHRPDQPQVDPPTDRGRTAPAKTWTEEVGEGVVATVTVSTGHHGFVSVVGESHYQDALRKLSIHLNSERVFRARLVPEANNPHDPNAVAVRADCGDQQTLGYLPRQVAKTYQSRLIVHTSPVTCAARLIGTPERALGVVLDFEDVRDALGLPRVSVDQSEMDYDAAAEYHRLNNANRKFVKETRLVEQSDLDEAVRRYKRAIDALCRCCDLAKAKGLDVYGFTLNQTDAEPIDRLTLCLVRMRRPDEAAAELEKFLELFPHARDMKLVKAARTRVNRALSRP